MKNLINILNDWEIQLLLLLSFGLQLFLFFSGRLRRHSANMFLRFSIWIAYLGADLVAVYALGYLSQHEAATTRRGALRETHPLAFFWAPFLLIHLGGQDTITAFAMEDNNLWLRHLLNLVVQVVLALYVFWKSIGLHSVELLASGLFVFVAGVIKYGERTWSLKCASFESLESSHVNQDYNHRLPEVIDGDVSYPNAVCIGLHSMKDVLNAFAARTLIISSFRSHGPMQPKKVLKVLGVELGVMCDDLYTKALVLRTRSGIVCRCISQISAMVAFVLFLLGGKQSYRTADIAITYSLFIGAFFLEACAVFIFMMSPWTWAWLKARGYYRLAEFSWYLFSSGLIGWPEKRPLWPNTMGQYNLMGWLVGRGRPRTFNQQLMSMIRNSVTLCGAEKKKIFWMSKLLDTQHVSADKMIMCLLEWVSRFAGDSMSQRPPEWPNLHPVLRHSKVYGSMLDFDYTIVFMHVLTELHLRKYRGNVSPDIRSLVKVCRQLSRYMMHLLVTHPSLLPLSTSVVATLKRLQADISDDEFMRDLQRINPQPGKETLEEIKELWIRLIMYAAAKSRSEMHAAQLARGGELLTFVWLLLAHHGIGDFLFSRMDLSNDRSYPIYYALHFPGDIL